MRLYRTGRGTWARTQDEARTAAKTEGTTWGPVDVPTDARGLVAFLNQLGAQAAPERLQELEAPPAATYAAPEPVSAPHAAPGKPAAYPEGSRCPKCCLTPRGAELSAQSDAVTIIGELVAGLDFWALRRVAEAVDGRESELVA